LETTIYPARRIITLNPSQPLTTHVAVREGRVLGTGSLDQLAAWGAYTLDRRFSDKVLMPGLVEGHSHVMEGTMWRYVYVGFHDRMDPNGRIWPGARSVDSVLERLSQAQAELTDAAQPLLAWGFDPIYFGEQRCSRQQLDRVSTSRPIAIMHASFHVINANSTALVCADLLRAGIDHPGISLGPDGLPTGELRGPDAMAPVNERVGFDRRLLSGDAQALEFFAKLCVRRGVTTATDLASPQTPEVVETMLQATGHSDFPTRIVPLIRLLGMTPRAAIERAIELKSRSTDRLRMGRLKIVADGSIQGFSARLRWPGYFNGAPNGLWYTAPEQIAEAYRLGLAHDVLIHTHTNGDEATELALDCLEAALRQHPSPDHRFTLQHCQLADTAQFRRMKALGVCVNLFANHHFYWGDAHYNLTVGPERANRMNACASARDCGVPFAIHSDAPVTPLGPLFTAWCAVNRLTSSGRVQGEHERISVAQALHAVTLGAAHTLKLDAEIGSIEIGKCADFAVLEDDPLTTPPEQLKEVRVWGVVQGGRIFAAE
jgi:predicted amidohydrolase YtcJ